MIHYFAYGSNLHPLRLTERVPSADLLGVVKQTHHRLSFHKKSNDGSSKCNLFNSGSGADSVYGAIYTLDPEHKSLLDGFEGNGYGYTDQQIKLNHKGREFTCFTYIAQQSHIIDNLGPYHWYKQLVVLGAKHLQFPESYIHSIESIASIEDPDSARKKEKEELIEKIINYR